MNSRFLTLNRSLALALSGVALAGALSACAPVVVGAAVGTGFMVASDRRTSGTQLEDQTIEVKAANRISDELGSRVRVSVTSFNRQVLLTGEAPNENDRQRVELIVRGVENVRATVNELGVTNSPSFTQRSSDALITTKVKAGFVDDKNLSANAFKVVTERGTVYLMGRVTQREADRATEIARTTSGVQRVVRVFELITEQELKQIQQQTAPADTATPKSN